MILLAIVGFIVVMVVSAILNGWALSVLWGWFFVPTLGLPDISVVQAIGIGMVVSYLTYQYIDTQSKDESWQAKLGGAVALAVIRPIFAVFFGWIVHSFM